MNNLLRASHVNIRVLEQTKTKLQFQNAPQSTIDEFHRNSTFLNVLDEGPHICRLVGDVYVHSGVQSESAGFLLRRHNAFIDQGSKSLAFADHNSLEAQLPAQNIVHPFLRAMGRDIFDVGIPGHHSESPILCNARSPWRKHVSTEHSI